MDLREARSVLGIDGPLSPEILKSAYRRAAKKYHPDRYQTFTEKRWATKRFVRVRKAYDLLRAAPARSAPEFRPPPAPDPVVVTPEETEIEIEIGIDPFRGWRTLLTLLFSPLRLLVGGGLSRRLDHLGLGGLHQPIAAILFLVLAPTGLGMLVIMVPVVIVHLLLLCLARAIESVWGTHRLSDAMAGSGGFLVVEVLVGGAILGVILRWWFSTDPLTTLEIVLGLALWAAPIAFLLVEIAGFVRTVLLDPR